MSREETSTSRPDIGDTDETMIDRSSGVTRIRALSRLLDSSIRVPGTSFRIGLDPILGILPGAGDAVSAGLSLYIIAESARLGVSNTTLLRMVGNVMLDFVGGSVPVLGTIFDATWKANRRNVDLALAELEDESRSDTETGRVGLD